MIIYDSSGSKIIGLDSDRYEDHYNLGVFNQSKGNIDDAIRNYVDALRIKPDLAQARSNLATIYYGQGKVTEALKEYKEALKITPDLIETYCNMGNAYCDLGEFGKAILCYRAFVEQAPSQYASQVIQVVQLIRDLEQII